MIRFTSRRERQLWRWVLAVVIAIYATLGLSGKLAGLLRTSDAEAVFFLLGMLLVVAAILTQGLKVRPQGHEIGIALGIVAVYFMVLLRLTLAERSHLFEYSILAALIFEALSERKAQGGQVPVPAVLAILATALVGVLDECIQIFLPHRVFDPVDIVFNSAAAAMAVGACLVLAWGRRYFRK